ncbi:hypothetical protein A9Q97_02800 [Rhodospirillales bacterium 47_12_T64]|nr:hypothetical protein A9Q97_02800 [Rhodospirillales bacterium 47_12_T64]
MSDLEELRQRVEAAEEHFGLIADQQKGYSQRLIALLNVTEQKDQAIDKLEGENEQLRTMLFSLLQAIEKGDTSNTLQDMDVRISAMTNQAADVIDELPAPDLSLPAPEPENSPEPEELSISDEANGADETENTLPEEDDLDIQLDTLEIEQNSEAGDEVESDTQASPEVSESQTDLAAPSQEEDSESGETEILEMSESDVPDDSEDALIAEIAENLEQVLPDEEEIELETAAENEGTIEELEDPMEDAVLADTVEEEATSEDKEEMEQEEDTSPISGNGEEVSEETSIDSFLEKNASEDETPAVSPEIEDIMERISKQALSQND